MSMVRLVLVVALHVASPALAAAQDPDSSPLRQRIQATRPSSVVRVELRDQRLLSGAILGAGATSVDLAGTHGTVVVPARPSRIADAADAPDHERRQATCMVRPAQRGCTDVALPPPPSQQ